jgi:acyl-ACP thioesterase
MSLEGDRGGHVELDSVWIHLGPDAKPARIADFDVYAESTRGRAISTRLELPAPPPESVRRPWPLRATDLDLLGHLNNAAYWDAVEERLAATIDPRTPFRARLDYRHALDLGDAVELVEATGKGALSLAFEVAGDTKAVALVEQVP